MVTQAPLDTARSTSAARTRDEDIMEKSSHMCGGRRRNPGDAKVRNGTIALTRGDNEDSADKRDERTNRKSAARELAVDQEQRQQDKSPRDVG